MKPSQLYIILLTAGVVLCGEPEEYQVAPCSIMAILSGRRVESEYCNLKMLLIRQLQTQSLNNPELAPYLRAQSEKRSYIPLPTCDGAGTVCRSGGRRACVCPSSYVCDPVDSGLHVCVKLKYLAMEDMRR